MEIRAPKPVRITKDEAMKMQWSMIARWKPRSDVWPFTYGNAILGSSAAVTAMYINGLTRKFLMLGKYGQKMSFAPMIIVPSTFAILAHVSLISSDILIKETPCNSCVEVRAVVSQLLIGLAYPIILAPFTCLYFANIYYTYEVPKMTEGRKLAKLWWKMTKPNLGRIRVIAAVQTLLAASITYAEIRALEKIDAKIDSDNSLL